ncbi:MAG: hypothetical protein Ta2A_09120 [Treponemataceae bacterium]|nr:MAG: hypothetical protein Ta2A_09120 [Treponemataceae bacterium]
MSAGLFALDYSTTVGNNLHFRLWAFVETIPGSENAKNPPPPPMENMLRYPLSQIREAAPFFVEGLSHGWTFEYTPSDRARKVEEYFDFKSIHPLSESEIRAISYSQAHVEGNTLYCWVDFPLDERALFLKKQQAGAKTISIHGKGYGTIFGGTNGIHEAAKEALKNAIRDYAQKITRNKPKEIAGSVIISQPPIVALDSGRYAVTLDFFLEISILLPYSNY